MDFNKLTTWQTQQATGFATMQNKLAIGSL
jgi:hypothetical protein